MERNRYRTALLGILSVLAQFAHVESVGTKVGQLQVPVQQRGTTAQASRAASMGAGGMDMMDDDMIG